MIIASAVHVNEETLFQQLIGDAAGAKMDDLLPEAVKAVKTGKNSPLLLIAENNEIEVDVKGKAEKAIDRKIGESRNTRQSTKIIVEKLINLDALTSTIRHLF